MSHDKYNNYLPNTWNTYSLDGVFQMVVGREKTDILDKCALNDSSVNVWRYENKLQYIQYLLRQQSLIENETGRTFYEVQMGCEWESSYTKALKNCLDRRSEISSNSSMPYFERNLRGIYSSHNNNYGLIVKCITDNSSVSMFVPKRSSDFYLEYVITPSHVTLH